MSGGGATSEYLAIDLGASSGRGVVGAFDGETLKLREVHRFANGPVRMDSGLHWDFPGLMDQVERSVRAAHDSGAKLAGMGIDTWGVDYGLLSGSGELLGPPFHYRDGRTAGMMDEAFAMVPRERIYARTGVQFMPLNTIYQLLAERRSPSQLLARASLLLFMPDLLNFFLTGIARSERSIASTSQIYDTGANRWAGDLLAALDLPESIFPEVADPGTVLGPLREEIAARTCVGRIPVIAPAGHDTGSAVAAVPATGDRRDWAYISSGTWSLVGRELLAPLRTPEALAANFTNECGVENTIRFHKNIGGLWLLQECQRVWAQEGHAYSFERLCELAMLEKPLVSLIDPDHASLAEFGDMPSRIRDLCARGGEPQPSSHGAIVRCILESLALKYRMVIESLETLTGSVGVIHIVGGGVQNATLCQFTADSTAREVLAGPVEATAAGNIMAQALAQERVSTLAEIRSILGKSFKVTRYVPASSSAWNSAFTRFTDLLGQTRA